MFLKRRVRYKSNLTAKHAKIANKKGSGPRKPVDRALVSGTKGRGFESRQARISPLWNFEESSLVSLLSHPTTRGCVKPAKACMVYFSLFVLFPLFAVQDSKTECPLYFRRENHRETRENREQKRECPQEGRKFSRGVAKAFERAKKS